VKNQNHDIENLFKEGFKNFEKPAGDKVWAGVKAGIKTSAATTTAVTAAKSAFGIGTKIAFVAAFVAIAAVSTYVILNNSEIKTTIAEQTEVQKVIPTENAADQIVKDLPLEETPITPAEEVVVVEKSESNEQKIVAETQTDKKKSTAIKEKSSNVVKSQAEPKTSSTSTNKVKETAADKTIKEDKKAVQTEIVKESKSPTVANNSNAVESSIVLNTTKGEAPFKIDFRSEFESSNYIWKLDGVTISNSKESSYTVQTAGTHELTLAVIDQDGKQKVTATTITTTSKVELTPPNIFTPNQDGQNDIFRIAGDFEKLQVVVLDKSGKEIHQWDGEYGFWDGSKPDGTSAAEGTYFYIIKYKIAGQNEDVKKGILTLKR
jgi:gliding motility-associated-like protein